MLCFSDKTERIAWCLGIFLASVIQFATAGTLALNTVQNITVTDIQSDTVTVQWDTVTKAKSYNIRLFQYITDMDSWKKIRIITKVKTDSKVIDQLQSDTTYSIQLRASQRSAWSKATTFTTTSATSEDAGESSTTTSTNENSTAAESSTTGGSTTEKDPTDCISNTSPVFTTHITDPASLANIVPPPSLAGTVLKTHSFLNTELGSVPVYAPVDAKLLNGAYYLETTPNGEYILTFRVSCEITFIVDHITHPIDAIRAVFAAMPKDNTMGETPSASIVLKAGDLIGHTTGTIFGIWDFGVYHSGKKNQFANDAGVTERDSAAVCPYDFFIADIRSQYYALFARSDEHDYPGATEFCTIEKWNKNK